MAYLIKDYSMSPFIKKSIAIAFLGAFFFLFSATTALADALPLTSGSGTTVAAPSSAIAQADNLLGTLTCEWNNVPGCIMKLPTFGLVYISYFIYILASGILAISGYLFDAVLSLSIDSTFISKPFVDSTWTIVRDFSNMLFIFILIYTGVLTILGEKNWAKTIKNVIIIALLINFSLFFTKVIIDAGNTLAVGVYSAIGVEKTDKIHTSGAVVERDLSAAIVSNFGPQTILGNVGKIESAYLVFAVFLIGTAVNLLAAWAFFRVALLFIGRIIGFWFLMIISPFAFISIALPKGNIFNKWLNTLLELSFVAPVFLFMLYIIMQVLAGGQLLSSLSSPSGASLAEFSFDAIFIPVVMVIFIYLALDKTINLTKSLSGDFGDIGAKIGGAVLGVTGGAVLGGTALVGRAVGGKFANKMFEGGKMQEWAASKDSALKRNIGMRGAMVLDTARKASWDARGVGLVGKGIKATGLNLGNAGGKGGYVQQEKDWIKEQKKVAALVEMSEKDKDAIKERYGVPATKSAADAQKTNTDALEGVYADAQIAHTNATRTAETTPTGAALKEAEEKLSEQKKLAAEAQEKFEKEEKAFNAANASGSVTNEMKESFDAANKAREAATSNLASIEKAVNEAKQAHQITNEYKSVVSQKEALEGAKRNLERAKELKKEADFAAKRALEQAERDINKEDERRREAYAGAKWTGSANLHKPFSAQERAEVVKKIRAGESDTEKADKEKAKMLKEIADEVSKEKK